MNKKHRFSHGYKIGDLNMTNIMNAWSWKIKKERGDTVDNSWQNSNLLTIAIVTKIMKKMHTSLTQKNLVCCNADNVFFLCFSINSFECCSEIFIYTTTNLLRVRCGCTVETTRRYLCQHTVNYYKNEWTDRNPHLLIVRKRNQGSHSKFYVLQ